MVHKSNNKYYKYEGNFKFNNKHGYGVEEILYDNKLTVYRGEFQDNHKHGKGYLEFYDGSYYEGEFVHGFPCGFGVFVCKSLFRAISVMSLSYSKESINELEKKKQKVAQQVNKVNPDEDIQDEEHLDGGNKDFALRTN